MSEFIPRPKQREVLAYRSGRMGIAAVPGSGKTRTLSELAALLLNEVELEVGQEVLIVTLSTSAVGNFSYQLRQIMQAEGVLSGFRYRVRTLHGLANDIVSERPDLVGLSDSFNIIDEREAGQILEASVNAWARGNPDALADYLTQSFAPQSKVMQRDFPGLMVQMAGAFIKQAKDEMIMPAQLIEVLDDLPEDELPLARMGAEVYRRYQQGLSYRGGVDFQDLIRLALHAVNQDAAYLERLRNRWPYILEDEAQDSSQLQERILRALTANDGNWVRVGDPNQAIYETFTTADPKFLRDFLTEQDVNARTLPNSGRSQPAVMALANQMIRWATDAHPVQAVRDKRPLAPPYIEPTPPGDPQPNPPDDPTAILLDTQPYTTDDELVVLVERLRETLVQHPQQTLVVLVPTNHRGYSVIDMLKRANVDHVELLQSSTNTREVAGTLYRVLNFLAYPTRPKALAGAYQVYRRDAKGSPEATAYVGNVMSLLQTCTQVETFVNPAAGGEDWLDTVTDDPELREELVGFRVWLRAISGAAALPVDQIVLTAAQTLFHEAVDLAAAYSLALQLRRDGVAQEHSAPAMGYQPRWGLADYASRLVEIAKNERKFLGVANEDQTFNPDTHAGKVVVTTIHRAKGLEWDHVFMVSVSDYDFPAGLPNEKFYGEKWYIRGSLNLQAEMLAQLYTLLDGTPYVEGHATNAARVETAAEKLRVLYVGITRARRALTMTWNTGRSERNPSKASVALLALATYWKELNA